MEPERPIRALIGKLYEYRRQLGYLAFLMALLTMAVQMYGEELGAVGTALVQLFGIVFFVSAGLSLHLTLFYSPQPNKEAIKASTTDEAKRFWGEVRKRRNFFYGTWIAWLAVGFPLNWIFSVLIPSADPMVPMYATVITYGAFWFWTAWRLTHMRCFNCGGKAFDHAFFFMKHAKCKSCGTPFVSGDASGP